MQTANGNQAATVSTNGIGMWGVEVSMGQAPWVRRQAWTGSFGVANAARKDDGLSEERRRKIERLQAAIAAGDYEISTEELAGRLMGRMLAKR